MAAITGINSRIKTPEIPIYITGISSLPDPLEKKVREDTTDIPRTVPMIAPFRASIIVCLWNWWII